jgi:hypothetical protein
MGWRLRVGFANRKGQDCNAGQYWIYELIKKWIFAISKIDELVKSRQIDGFVKSSRCQARNPAPSGTDGLFTRPSKLKEGHRLRNERKGVKIGKEIFAEETGETNE